MFAEFEYNELENESYVEPTSKKIAITNTTQTYKVKKMAPKAPPDITAAAVAQTITVQKAPEPASDDQLCCICMDSKKSVLLIPCKHLCMCNTCGLREDIMDCPLCVSKIENRMQIFT